jgi:hypothetical protein
MNLKDITEKIEVTDSYDELSPLSEHDDCYDIRDSSLLKHSSLIGKPYSLVSSRKNTTAEGQIYHQQVEPVSFPTIQKNEMDNSTYARCKNKNRCFTSDSESDQDIKKSQEL